MDYVEPFTFNSIRCLIGGLVLIPCIAFLDALNKKNGGKSRAPKTRDEKKLLLKSGILCGTALFGASILQQYGISFTTVGKAGFITSMYIVLVPVFGVFLHKRIGIRVACSVVIALFGLYLLCMTESLSIGKGDLLVLLCAVVFSVHILLVDHYSPRVDGVRLSCIQFFICGILSGIGMLIFDSPSLSSILAAAKPILYAGVLSCGVAYTLQIIAQKNVEPTTASLLMSLESVFSVLAGWVVLHQKLSLREGFGCILMFFAIVLAELPERKKV